MKAGVFFNRQARPCKTVGCPVRVDPALSVLDKAFLNTDSFPP